MSACVRACVHEYACMSVLSPFPTGISRSPTFEVCFILQCSKIANLAADPCTFCKINSLGTWWLYAIVLANVDRKLGLGQLYMMRMLCHESMRMLCHDSMRLFCHDSMRMLCHDSMQMLCHDSKFSDHRVPGIPAVDRPSAG